MKTSPLLKILACVVVFASLAATEPLVSLQLMYVVDVNTAVENEVYYVVEYNGNKHEIEQRYRLHLPKGYVGKRGNRDENAAVPKQASLWTDFLPLEKLSRHDSITVSMWEEKMLFDRLVGKCEVSAQNAIVAKVGLVNSSEAKLGDYDLCASMNYEPNIHWRGDTCMRFRLTDGKADVPASSGVAGPVDNT